jgi:hypothetical protein
MGTSIETIIEQIRPLIVSLSAEDRLALIQAIAGVGQIEERRISSPVNSPPGLRFQKVHPVLPLVL